MYISTETVLALALVGGQAAAAIAARSAAGQPGVNLDSTPAYFQKRGPRRGGRRGGHNVNPPRHPEPLNDSDGLCQSMPRHSCLALRSVAVEEEEADELGAAGRTRPAKRSIRYRDPSKPRPRLPKGAAYDVALSWSRAVKRTPEEPATPL